MFINNKNSFQSKDNHTDTSVITNTTITQSIKQPRHQLVPESEKMKNKTKTKKQIRAAFPTTPEDSPPLKTFADLSIPSKVRKNTKPQKGCGFCCIKWKGEQVKNFPKRKLLQVKGREYGIQVNKTGFDK